MKGKQVSFSLPESTALCLILSLLLVYRVLQVSRELMVHLESPAKLDFLEKMYVQAQINICVHVYNVCVCVLV